MEQPNEQQQPVFTIEKLYVKDMSIEVPNAPKVFREIDSQPEVGIDMATKGTPLEEEGFYEVALTVTVTAKLGEDKVLFLVETTQAGVFQIRNIPDEELQAVLMIACANILYPYAREVIASAVIRAGFQPIHLSPVNFEAMYMARQQQTQAPLQ